MDFPDLLCNLAQLLSGWMYDESWSAWDQEQYDKLINAQTTLAHLTRQAAETTQHNKGET